MHDESAPNTTWSGGLSDDISRVILSEETIQRRVAELGAQIAADYQGRDLLVVGVLSGSFLFIADLVRQINLPLALDFISVSSYGDRTRSSGVVRMLKDLNQPIAGRDVLLVEDIIDTGLTIANLIEVLETRNPRSIRVAALLDKKSARKKEVPLHYAGFEIPKEFVIGYGLDYDEKYRNLPFIGIMKA